MSSDEQREKLGRMLDALRRRWGSRALFTGREGRAGGIFPVISTGFHEVDRLLEIGGLPRGRISEFIGSGTSGYVTLAAHVLSQAQRAGFQVVYVDVGHTIDLDYLARCGVSFDSLVILRPLSFHQALDMIRDLIIGGGAGVILFDRLYVQQVGSKGPTWPMLDRALREWTGLVGHSLCTVIFLTQVTPLSAYPEGLPLPYFASIRLGFEWRGWLGEERRVLGFRSRVSVLKNKLGSAERSVTIDMGVYPRTGEVRDEADSLCAGATLCGRDRASKPEDRDAPPRSGRG